MISNDYGVQLNNIGIQLQNIGLQISNMGMISQNVIIQKIAFEVSNMGIQIFNYGTQINNIINNMNSINMEMMAQMKMIQPMMNMNMNINNNSQKKHICICDDPNIIEIYFNYYGKKKLYFIDKETTVENILNKYINENNLNQNGIYFLFNGQKLDINDKRQIKDISFGSLISIQVCHFGL